MTSLLNKMMKSPVKPGNVKASERPLTVALSTFFYTGYLPKAPGTWGSLATVIVAYFILPKNPIFQIIVITAVTLIGVFVSKRAEEIFGKDGGPIVIDETAGQLTTLIAVPINIYYYLIAFFLFRFFDIVKPFPARRSEKIPNGWGVMADDVIAGIYGCISIHLIIYMYTNYIG
ncbi:MAG: phosphatidylglycerophosphatase A [candidate division Zixibacteria bacterium]|nr:phosphatidylglycerophosphatase A [candidate division Zixibacteria bacterium]